MSVIYKAIVNAFVFGMFGCEITGARTIDGG